MYPQTPDQVEFGKRKRSIYIASEKVEIKNSIAWENRSAKSSRRSILPKPVRI
ncbi:hypothetical protein BFG60_2351 [Microcystis aeruginosa NIES-98]|nr:hypothetical protein BFG60_2351 [Microcystis aeruginosa NIES-98]